VTNLIKVNAQSIPRAPIPKANGSAKDQQQSIASPALDNSVVTSAQIQGVLKDPSQLPSFLAKNRMSDKYHRQADEHSWNVQAFARQMIIEVEAADNRVEIIAELNKDTGQKKISSVERLILLHLIEYKFPKDAQYLSQDLGIQKLLATHQKEGKDAAIFIKENGGLRGSYDRYREEKRQAHASKPSKPRFTLKALVSALCPDPIDGEYTLAVVKYQKNKPLLVLNTAHLPPMDNEQAVKSYWHALMRASGEAEAKVSADAIAADNELAEERALANA
jgi:hypothetical protein